MAIVVTKRKWVPIVHGYQCECIADNVYMVNASGKRVLFGGGA